MSTTTLEKEHTTDSKGRALQAADYIRVHRRARGLTQAALAKRLKIAQSSVQAWEVGEAMPKPKYIPTLSKLLGINPITLSQLVDEHEKRHAARRR